MEKYGYPPIKIMWFMGDTLTKIAYVHKQKDADDAVNDPNNKSKGIPTVLYRSEGRYIKEVI